MLSILVDSSAANEHNCKYYIKFSTILLKLLGLVETTIKRYLTSCNFMSSIFMSVIFSALIVGHRPIHKSVLLWAYCDCNCPAAADSD